MKVAYATIALWLLAALILSTQVIQLDRRIVYSEEPFLPRGSESFEGLQVLEKLGYSMGDTLLVIFKPSSLEYAKTTESVINETLNSMGIRGYKILGPYTIYSVIRGYVEGNLSLAVSNALKAYEKLRELGLKARDAFDDLRFVLNETYGFANLYLKLYWEAVNLNISDPAVYAYEKLKHLIPADKLALLEGFHRYFTSYEKLYRPEEAARRALIDLSKLYKPEVTPVLERFDFTNYSDTSAIASYVYEVSGVKAYNVTLDLFKHIILDPEGVALNYVKMSLVNKTDTCMGLVFDDALKGVDVRSSIKAHCEDYISGIIEYPDVIPGSIRRVMLSGDYGIVYVSFNESIPIDFSRRILAELDRRLKNVVSEAYYHGTLALFADLGENTEREVRRIDVVTAILVIGLLVVLLGSIASPIIIIIATIMSLIVSLGLLSVVALYVDVYYLARVVMLPIVFGITVDYSVFYLFRVVEERSKGLEWGEAVYQAWRRAGRALTLGGIAVVLGFLAYVITPQEALRGIGLALTIASATSFLSSYTLLPALLITLGERRVFWPAKTLRLPAARQGVLLRRVAGASLRLSLMVTLLVLALTLGLALYLLAKPPSANVHLGLPPYSRFIEASSILYTEFPKDAFSKIYIIVTPTSSNVTMLLESLRSLNLIAGNAIISRVNDYIIVEVGLPVDPLDDRVFDIIDDIRSSARELGVNAMTSGFPALRVDAVNSILSTYFKITLPLAITLILAYLIAGMGSIVVPLRLIITVAFSAILSITITMLVFHYLTEAPASGSYVRSPLYWVTPIIVLGLMVTLGMDYDIFLTSRIREEYERLKEQDEAILEAVERTGVVITVCGLILAGAFSSLLLTEAVALRQVGFTVALSILIDTFLVRPVIVPAIMSLAGRYNWWPGKGLIRRWD